MKKVTLESTGCKTVVSKCFETLESNGCATVVSKCFETLESNGCATLVSKCCETLESNGCAALVIPLYGYNTYPYYDDFSIEKIFIVFLDSLAFHDHLCILNA